MSVLNRNEYGIPFKSFRLKKSHCTDTDEAAKEENGEKKNDRKREQETGRMHAPASRSLCEEALVLTAGFNMCVHQVKLRKKRGEMDKGCCAALSVLIIRAVLRRWLGICYLVLALAPRLMI
ncbi:uncharacterized [Tachysurus ichikawai]